MRKAKSRWPSFSFKDKNDYKSCAICKGGKGDYSCDLPNIGET